MGLTFSRASPFQSPSPLFQPAMEGDATMLKSLIGRYIAGYEYVNVNSAPLTSSKYDPKLQSYVNSSGGGGSQGNTPLIAAAYGGHLEIVEFLVDKCGADITIKNDIGCSPIWVAAGYSRIAVLEFFISHVVKKERKSETGGTGKVAEILFEGNKTGDSPFLAGKV